MRRRGLRLSVSAQSGAVADDRPTLRTERLVLRPFTQEDAPRVVELAGAREVADTMLAIPHPYPPEAATSWIATHADAWAKQEFAEFALTLVDSGDLIGATRLGIERTHDSGEIGYWLGVGYWNHGYCTEAARAVVAFGFEQLGLHRIMARHLTRNPASGRVMQKIGMTFEGTLRAALKKGDVYEDVALYAILADEWRGR